MTSRQSPESPLKPLPLLDTDLVRSFVAIAETGSFTRAARQVFRTPGALSMQIKRLEGTLGQALFVRDARQVRLTPEGEVLLSFGRRLLKLNEETVTQFLAPRLEGRVRFGTPDDVGTRLLPGVLAQFARSHPAVQVDVIVGGSRSMLEKLDNGELDVVLITNGNEGQDPSRGEVVHTDTLVWAGRDGGDALRRSPLPLALANHGCAWRAMALSALDAAGIAYRVAYTCENCAGQEAALLADLAVAPIPRKLVRAPLRVLGEESGLPSPGSYQLLMVRREGRGPASDALAGYVLEQLHSPY
ncbi:LysR family transcriptional regulator [Saccharospirillum mangrovi]|uniref:LysR family transcriptional regulator n=1 Tax=Saccharospirillum mangrovi TaxID=2161747 RepID=UPI000D35C957|nr:LysR substrate-binding domain-containing protein [Saccharospirillum mangrovi]